ncbi:MAG: MATE family efflux transporter [Firmicutes bacterium CAG:137_57_8]|nr:MAG: MATE family efflux transporter [Firmicutes bacterium CAG:137_57_8]
MKQLSAEEKFQQMTQTPVRPLICKMAVPTIISMLITTIYNMADTFFIGKLNSTSASGAVGIAFSLMAVIQACGFFFGQGAGNNMSRELGHHEKERAEQLAATGFFSAILCGVLILVFGSIFLRPLTMLLGSTETIAPYAMDYIRVILLGAPYMTASLVLNNLLRFQGNAFYGMLGLTSGGILNIVLDPILIFGCRLGISGAAWATIISQLVGFLILFYQCNHAGIVKIRLRNVRISGTLYRKIVNGGLPSLLRQGVASLATICLNLAAKPYGDAAIAAMAIVSRIANFTNSVIIGFGQGFQPVCGYNYGARLYGRVRQGFWFCVQFSTVFLQCLTFPFFGWLIISNMMMQTMGKAVRASILGIARQGIFLIPVVLLLPQWIGIWGIQLAQPIADIVSCLLAVPLQLQLLRQMRQEEQLSTSP